MSECLTRRVLNSDNLVASAALAEACTLLNAILVLNEFVKNSVHIIFRLV